MSADAPIGDNPYESPSYDDSSAFADDKQSTTVSFQTLEMLRQTRPWVLFLSILGFISAGLMILGGGCMSIVGLASVVDGPSPMGASSVGLAAMYAVIGLLYLVPSIHLYRYGARIGMLLQFPGQQYLEQALESQKSFWKFVGIMTAIILVLYAVLFVAMFFGMAVLQLP